MVVAQADTGLRSWRTTGRENRDTMTDGGAAQLTLGDRAALAAEAVRAGAHEAFAAAVHDLTPLLWNVVRAQDVPREIAEDVVQGVWLAFVQHVGRLRDTQGALKWLLVTARRAAWEALRKHREHERRTEAELETDPVEPSAGPEDLVVLTERDRVLWRNVRALDARCRELLRILAFADRASYRDIAEATGIGLTSVGATRGRCLEKLRARLAQDEGWTGHD